MARLPVLHPYCTPLIVPAYVCIYTTGRTHHVTPSANILSPDTVNSATAPPVSSHNTTDTYSIRKASRGDSEQTVHEQFTCTVKFPQRDIAHCRTKSDLFWRPASRTRVAHQNAQNFNPCFRRDAAKALNADMPTHIAYTTPIRHCDCDYRCLLTRQSSLSSQRSRDVKLPVGVVSTLHDFLRGLPVLLITCWPTCPFQTASLPTSRRWRRSKRDQTPLSTSTMTMS